MWHQAFYLPVNLSVSEQTSVILVTLSLVGKVEIKAFASQLAMLRLIGARRLLKFVVAL
ncbi:MAG: hypothetical protein ACUVTP_12865 [Candidatus Fervidibacter sp.]